MIRRFKAKELAESIVSGGFYTFDPIVGFQDGNEVTVLEGNRRTATLQLLLNPDLAPKPRQAEWRELADRLRTETKTQIARVNVQVFSDRDSANVTAYIGFRHVTGVLRWPAIEKAGFIAKMIDTGMLYGELAQKIGSYAKHVERHYVAYQVVQQAHEERVDGVEAMEDRFGVLLRALQSSDILAFLGIEFGLPPPRQCPVPADRLEDFRQFVRWTFGTEDSSAVLTDSRDLTKWGTILQSQAAIGYLRRADKPIFDRAWLKSGGQATSLRESLLTASDRLEESVPLVPEHRNDEDVKEAVQLCANYLSQILLHFPDARCKYFPGDDYD